MPMQNEIGPSTKVTGVNLNAVGDTFVPIGSSKFIVRRMTLYDASVSLGASAATIGAYTGAGATGTTIVTPATATALTAATKYTDRTVALTTDYVTTTGVAQANGQVLYGLFIRVGVAHGSAATCSVSFDCEALD